MFGVDSSDSPHQKSWLCDFDRVTLTDLSRGTPTSQVSSAERPITAATLYRAGPDVRAANTLIGANTLFRDFSANLSAVIKLTRDLNPELSEGTLLQVWAAGNLALYRSYPLMMATALKARALQRMSGWHLAVPEGLIVDLDDSEYGSQSSFRGESPMTLEVLDSTLRELGIGPSTGALPATLNPGSERPLSRKEDLLTAVLDHVLNGLGATQESEPTVIWAVENTPGYRTVDVFLQKRRVLTDFIQRALPSFRPGSSSIGLDTNELPIVPIVADSLQIAALTSGAKRLYVEVTANVLEWLDDRGEQGGLFELEKVVSLARAELMQDDPVRLSAEVGWLLKLVKGTPDHGILPTDSVVTSLFAALDSLREQLLRGSGSVGYASEVLSRGCVALNSIRKGWIELGGFDETMHAQIYTKLTQYWDTFSRALQVPRKDPRVKNMGYHLHNYAGFAGEDNVPAGIAKGEMLNIARTLFIDDVIPSRRKAAESTGRDDGLRTALQVGAAALTRLAKWQLDGGDPLLAEQNATQAGQWAIEALNTQDAANLQKESSDPKKRRKLLTFAERVVPALIIAEQFSHEHPAQPPKVLITPVLDSLISAYQDEPGYPALSQLKKQIASLT